MSTYVAEIQGTHATKDRFGTAAEVAAWLASWHSRSAKDERRGVQVHRIESSGDWTMVDRRTTAVVGKRGADTADCQAGVERDAAWDAAVASVA